MSKVTYAIGDIHGHMDLLTGLIKGIEEDITENEFTEVKIIFLGDYVDRGPKTKQVIEYLRRKPFPNYETICLMGNHEDMFISAIFGGRDEQEFYLYNGGERTMASYRIGAERTEKYKSQWDMIPQKHIDWMMDLPYMHIDKEAGYVFVHAGVFPERKLEEQDKYECLWIRKLFLNHPNPCDLTVVHGHTPTHDNKVEHLTHRINVDTRAYATGIMTAVVLHDGVERFISVDKELSITHY